MTVSGGGLVSGINTLGCGYISQNRVIEKPKPAEKLLSNKTFGVTHVKGDNASKGLYLVFLLRLDQYWIQKSKNGYLAPNRTFHLVKRRQRGGKKRKENPPKKKKKGKPLTGVSGRT